MARDFVTSSRSTCGETLVLCQNKTRSNGLVKTSARANRHPHNRRICPRRNRTHPRRRTWRAFARAGHCHWLVEGAAGRRGIAPSAARPETNTKTSPGRSGQGQTRHETALACAFARELTRTTPGRPRRRNPHELVASRQKGRTPAWICCALARRPKSRPKEKEKTLVIPSARRSGIPRTLPIALVP